MKKISYDFVVMMYNFREDGRLVMNRRDAMVGGILGSFFSWLGIAKAETPPNNETKGFITVYQNVGQLPPFKVEAFVERIGERLKNKKMGWTIIVVPVRSQETRIEFYPLDGKTDVNGKLEQIKGIIYSEEHSSSICLP